MKRGRDNEGDMVVSAANLRHPKRRGAVIRQVFMAALQAPPGQFVVPEQFPVNTKGFLRGAMNARTLMKLALTKGDVPLVRQLVARGADFDLEDALLTAVIVAESFELLQWLLETHGAALTELLSIHGADLAVLCARRNCVQSLNLLHGAGMCMAAKDHATSETPLQAALTAKDAMQAACWLLEACSATATAKWPNGDTCAIVAARRGQLEVLDALHRAGADMETKSCNGDTAILAAAKAGKWDVVRWLLAHYPAIQTQTRRQRTTVASYAVEANALDVLQTLHARNIPLHTRNIAVDKDHNTLLISAATHGHVDMVRFLASCRGMPLDARNKNFGTTAAHNAAQHSRQAPGMAMLQALHDHGATLHVRSKSSGNTILHNAARLNYVDMMLWILDAVPQLTGFEKNLHGETAVDILNCHGYHYAARRFETAAQMRQDQRNLRWSAARAAWCAAATSAAV
jgi:ankyrin repeat protein